MVGERMVSLHGTEIDISYLDEGTLEDTSVCFEDFECDYIDAAALSNEQDQVCTRPFLGAFLRDLEAFPNLVALNLWWDMDAASVIELASYLEQCSLHTISFYCQLEVPHDTAYALFKSIAANSSIQSLVFNDLTPFQIDALSLTVQTGSGLLQLQLDWSEYITDAMLSAVCSLVSKTLQLESFSITFEEMGDEHFDMDPLLQQLIHNRSLKSLRLSKVSLTDNIAHHLRDLLHTISIEELYLSSRGPPDELLTVLASIESSSLTSATFEFFSMSVDSYCSTDQIVIALGRALQCPSLEVLSMDHSFQNISVEALCRALQHRSCALKELNFRGCGTIELGNGVSLDPHVFSGIQRLSLDTTLEEYSTFFRYLGELPDLFDIRISIADLSPPPRLPPSLLHALQSKQVVSLGVLYLQSQEDLVRIKEALYSNTSILRLVMIRDFTSDATKDIRQILDRNRDLYFVQQNALLHALFSQQRKHASLRCLLDPRLIDCIQSYIPPELPTEEQGITYTSW